MRHEHNTAEKKGRTSGVYSGGFSWTEHWFLLDQQELKSGIAPKVPCEQKFKNWLELLKQTRKLSES